MFPHINHKLLTIASISTHTDAWQFSSNAWGEQIDISVDFTGVFTMEEKVTSGGNLDSVRFDGDKLVVNGWFAAAQAQGKAYAFAILTNEQGSQEFGRTQVNITSRPDVPKVYPDIPNGANSGFSASFDYSNQIKGKKLHLIFRPTSRGDVQQAHPDIFDSELSGFSGQFAYSSDLVGHQLQVIARFSDDEHGEGNHIDYWFEPIKGPQLPVLDGKLETEVLVHEFSASKADNDLISLKFK